MNDYTEKLSRFNALHQLLNSSDYWTSKNADGEYSVEEWQAKSSQRRAWREELRALEAELPALELAYNEEQERTEQERWAAEQARLAAEADLGN